MSELWRRSAVEIADLVKGREVSAREVTESALARLAAVNPAINAVIDEFPEEALQAADRVDGRWVPGATARIDLRVAPEVVAQHGVEGPHDIAGGGLESLCKIENELRFQT